MSQLQFQVNFGKIAITWNSEGLVRQVMLLTERALTRSELPIPPAVCDCADRLREYVDYGTPIGEIPWNFFDQSGWTGFQKQIYYTIARIPHGETRTYGWVAARVGKLGATRAVGQALKRNPLPILIPCHRVTASQSLGGFMGKQNPTEPELRLKQKLISIEHEYRNPVFEFVGVSA